MRRASALVRFVARVPARVQIKLLAAFLAIEVLLIVMGAVGLHVLSGVNQRTDELIRLQRKIEAYRQVPARRDQSALQRFVRFALV